MRGESLYDRASDKSTDPAGLPAGGTADQILAKIDATDYNAHWIDASGLFPWFSLGLGTANDTTRINAALAAYRGVAGVPGQTYTINARLVIPSNTILDLRGCTVVLSPASDTNMIVDSAHHAGTLTVPSPVENYHIIGGIWDRGANAGTGLARHSMILGGRNFTVIGATFKSTAGKYGILVQNALDFKIRDIVARDTFSGAVQVQGPASRGTVKTIQGKTGEDAVVINVAGFNENFFTNEDNVTDILVDGVHITEAGGRHVAVLSGRKNGTTALLCDRIEVRNVTGTQRTGNVLAPVLIGDDLTYTGTSQGNLGTVSLLGLSVAVDSDQTPLVRIGGNGSSLRIKTVRIDGVALQSDCMAVVQVSRKVEHLNLSNATGSTATKALFQGVLHTTGNTGDITSFVFSDSNITTPGAVDKSCIDASNTISVLGSVLMSNVFHSGCSTVASFSSTTTQISFSNCRFPNNTEIIRAVSSAVTVNGWSGCTTNSTTNVINAASTLRSRAPAFPIDIAHARITAGRVDGDVGTNTNGGAGIPANRLVFFNGTNWIDLSL